MVPEPESVNASQLAQPEPQEAFLLLISTAFQSALEHCQVTCLLVDSEYTLVHVCGDALGLLPVQVENGGSKGKSVIDLLASLQLPIDTIFKEAQRDGQAACMGFMGHQSPSSEALPSIISITVTLHRIAGVGEDFLTVLIEREKKNISSEKSSDADIVELLEENERLRAKVLEQQKTEQMLACQAQDLAHSNADLEEFAYVISHDLQEPLRAMTAFSQLLGQRYKEQLNDSAKGYINHIVDGGIRMKAMIDGILELSRINNNKQPVEHPTDLEQVVETVLENLELIRSETQATITHNALPTVYVDESHAVQLLQNLISNAIKFRGLELPTIHITAQQQFDKWLFSISDNGIGIPKDQQKRIFKLFQRLHNQQEKKGYGIGLAICKKIVEHYQGDIWLESSPGQGAIFYFTLTVKADHHEA